MPERSDTHRGSPTAPAEGGADATDGPWRIWIDTGGTFTDCLGVDPAGGVHRAKVLSSGRLRGRVVAVRGRRVRVEHLPAAGGLGARALVGMSLVAAGAESPHEGAGAIRVVGLDAGSGELELAGAPPGIGAGSLIELGADEEAPILAARLITGTGPGEPLPPIRMRLGTTRATNALLEGQGAPVVLFITRGFADLLEIGTQQRPELFALKIQKPPPMHRCVVEVAGRLDAQGRELEPLDLDAVREAGRRALGAGIPAAAVCLMHSWTNPGHERRVGEALRETGFGHVSLSADLAPLIRILPRAQTAVVNATLSPVIEGYLGRVAGAPGGAHGDSTRGSSLHLMTSGGGLVRARDFAPKDSLLSGPAGGVVGAAAAGRAAGFERTIAFDMGGTSTDVSRFDGAFAYAFEHTVGSAHIVAPALAIESVAAGGGSVCWVDRAGGAAVLRVGPRSAGARPGPACYGAGGPLTITDCNLLLGRLDPEGFQIPLRTEPARARLMELVAELDAAAGTGATHDPDDVAAGLLRIAAERMAEAIARVSIRQGYDPSGYALVAFGGAGGQHACPVARRLGIRVVVVPRDAGLLSALGLGAAAVERFAERQVLAPLHAVKLDPILSELGEGARAAVAAEGIAPGRVAIRRRLVQMRLVGQDTSLTVEHRAGGTREQLAAAFRDRYTAMYGHAPPERAIEVESLRVVAASEEGGSRSPGGATESEGPVDIGARSRRAHFNGGWRDTAVIERASLAAGRGVPGPALILDPYSTTVVEPGWTARADGSGALVLEDAGCATVDADRQPEAVRDELSTGRLRAIARDMGEMLQRTALSTNVKERLDFSCAILDPGGRLIVNAPHIPVHLGALGVCVRRVREAIAMGPGDSVMTNHPAFGGSHLPDITVITPVFDTAASPPLLLGYAASRAHHAEVGGIKPGSMPTEARSLAEEGVVIPPMHLVRAGVARWETVESLLTAGPFLSRAPGDNLADLRAQLAANHHGAEALAALAAQYGAPELRRAMEGLTARARTGAEAALERLAARGSSFAALELLDDGSPVRVSIDLAPPRARIDFGGSAGVHPGNLNATAAIVRSAVMYVLRLMIDEPLPLNEGILEPIDLRVPRGMLDPEFPADPALCPPVAGGNVETSQRIVDTLIKALGLCACSQGTMNNVIFGDRRFGYYETVCGGAGAGPGFAGASAVHTHMTNTRITDPEVLERRYPVRLERFAIRRGSGGSGRWRGGDGVVREMVFLAPCELSVLTQHRVSGPCGAAGGGDGRPGAQRLIRAGGAVEVLAPIDRGAVGIGDRLVLETPGGGGWGEGGSAAAPVVRSSG